MQTPHKQTKYGLTSVNSINFGRIMAQVVHYFHAYFQVCLTSVYTICTHVCSLMYRHAHTHIYEKCMCVYNMYIHIYTCMYIHVCIYLWKDKFTFIHMTAHLEMYMPIHMHTHIYTHIQRGLQNWIFGAHTHAYIRISMYLRTCV